MQRHLNDVNLEKASNSCYNSNEKWAGNLEKAGGEWFEIQKDQKTHVVQKM